MAENFGSQDMSVIMSADRIKRKGGEWHTVHFAQRFLVEFIDLDSDHMEMMAESY